LIVARFAQVLAELLRSGVPVVEALRVLAPTFSTASGFAVSIRGAAERIERGEDLAQALDDERWFDAEFRRLLDVGQAAGDLDQLLMRIAERYGRHARRLIDRLAALLEPVVILLLALMVGAVVMAAVLPLLRLREML
jgi:type II secretory pathway component PulF